MCKMNHKYTDNMTMYSQDIKHIGITTYKNVIVPLQFRVMCTMHYNIYNCQYHSNCNLK